MKTKSLKLSVQRGFSLVELLVVIAVIAIIAAIAIPNIANITQQAGIAKDQRNAQSVASVAAAAIAAGHEPTWTDAAGVYADLVDDGTATGGVNVTMGGNQMHFGISPLSQAEQDALDQYLTVTPGTATSQPLVNYKTGQS